MTQDPDIHEIFEAFYADEPDAAIDRAADPRFDAWLVENRGTDVGRAVMARVLESVL